MKTLEEIQENYGETIDELGVGESDDVLTFLRFNNATELKSENGDIPAGQVKIYELRKPDRKGPKEFIIYNEQILQKE